MTKNVFTFCACAVLASILTACDQSGPMAPPTVVATRISPQITGLKVGDVQQFNIVEAMSDGSERTVVDVTWASDSRDVITIDAVGLAHALRVGHATLSAVAGGAHVTIQIGVVPDLTGSWNGRFRIADCTRQSGPGPSPCTSVVGAAFGMSTTLAQVHDRYTGTMRLFDSAQTGAVSGTVDELGGMSLTGQLSGGGITSDFTLWTATLAPEASLSGRFKLRQTFVNAFGTQLLTYDCEFASLSR